MIDEEVNELPTVTLNDLVNRDERSHRKQLLERAKQGCSESRSILKREYQITSLWDGKQLINL